MLPSLSGKIKTALRVFELILTLFIAIVAYNFLLPIGPSGKFVYFQANDAETLLQTLRKNGYHVYGFESLLIDTRKLPLKGWYEIANTDLGRYRFFQNIDALPARTMRIKIYAAETHRELLRRLAKDMKLDIEKLSKYYQQLQRFGEGDIIAGTYELPRKADENTAITFLFEQSKAHIEAFKRKRYVRKLDDDTLKLLLTIASIIQKETNRIEEMPLISSVIYNRLERDMKLQMDGTLNYGEFSHRIVTAERIRNDESFYNTYKYKGLPPAPLGSVSLEALDAAMFPAQSDYLFFMLKKGGSHAFSKTYKEHLNHIKAFKAHLAKRKREKSQKK